MMKLKTPLFICTLLASGLAAQVASAQTVTVQNSQGMGLRYDFGTSTASQVGNSPLFRGSTRNQAGTALNPTTGIANKIWLQFDLSSVWATYGQANLASATITLWGENGNNRRFDVVVLNDGVNEAWTASTLSWATAPGNVVNSGYAFSSSTLIYQRTSSAGTPTDPLGVSLVPAVPIDSNYDQCARFTSGDISSFLALDTDGKVTLMMGDGVYSDNSTWWYGPAGSYDVGPTYQTADGQVIRDSPTLTLTFAPVPEPATLSLVVLGLGGLFLVRRRR
jgi:hypothetical protein